MNGPEPFYSAEERQYITDHLIIEREHNTITRGGDHDDGFAALLCDQPAHWLQVEQGLNRTCDALGNFWVALTPLVFPPSNAAGYL